MSRIRTAARLREPQGTNALGAGTAIPAGEFDGGVIQAPDGSLTFPVAGLLYRLDRMPRLHGRRSVASVRLDGGDGSTPLVDRLDLFAYRSRKKFASLVADVFGREVGTILGHLALILDHVERLQQGEAEPQPEELTPEREAAARDLLDRPGLLDLAADAMTALGYVGEPQNKRLAYLVATSRLLSKPLSAILMAPSGCGKSELLEVTAKLMPPESVEFLSRLTPQSLFYAGQDALKHKIVMVDEQAGASEADYSLRTLQSKGLLRLRVTVKGRSEPFTVYGPISLMSGTTSSDLNPENLSRCLEFALDDSPAQTIRIQDAQRRAWSGQRPRPVDSQLWQDAQRLLERLSVVIPFASKLSFPARTTHDRRGNQKLLGLVASHALLHQRQRKRDRQGNLVATRIDYAAIHALLQPVVAHQLDGLSPRAARLYHHLVSNADPCERTRRDFADELSWGYNTAKRALAELLDQELVKVTETGPPARYRLLDRSLLGAATDLLPPSDLG